MADVVVVDNDASLRVVIRMVLERAGFEVREASHGAEALEMCSRNRPDVVLADLRMPIVGGRELARRMEADPALRSIPVILLTGDRDAAEEGPPVASVLVKPFEPDDLLAAVRAFAEPSLDAGAAT